MGRNEFVNSVEKSLRTSSARVKKSAKFFRDTIPYASPAFLVSVGYMDPGNWGTDLAAGSQFGYQLLWVLLVSNLISPSRVLSSSFSSMFFSSSKHSASRYRLRTMRESLRPEVQ